MVLHVTGELTRLMRPGDPVTVSGIFLPEPFTGFRAAKAGLLTSTFLLVQRVLSDKQSYNAISMDVGHDAAIQVPALESYQCLLMYQDDPFARQLPGIWLQSC
jgi:DNA replicative helicase MCM subunit Mcm2 (Cdc46/Mcm family)